MRLRISYPRPFKAQVVQECLSPDVSIASVALRLLKMARQPGKAHLETTPLLWSVTRYVCAPVRTLWLGGNA